MPEFDLYLAAQRLLEVTVDELEQQGIVMPGLIYLAPGNEIPFDCEQFTLHLTRILGSYQGTNTNVPQHHALLMNSAEIWATMVRCVPVPDDNGNMPHEAALNEATGQLMRDGRALRRAFERIDQKHLFVPKNVPVSIGDVTSIGPSGGFAAVTGSFTFQMVDANWADSPSLTSSMAGKFA
jgi:hypothetical protein